MMLECNFVNNHICSCFNENVTGAAAHLIAYIEVMNGIGHYTTIGWEEV